MAKDLGKEKPKLYEQSRVPIEKIVYFCRSGDYGYIAPALSLMHLGFHKDEGNVLQAQKRGAHSIQFIRGFFKIRGLIPPIFLRGQYHYNVYMPHL